jgi:uncharacterized protein YjbI with pentapeptide repeats
VEPGAADPSRYGFEIGSPKRGREAQTHFVNVKARSFQGSNFRNCLFNGCNFANARLDHSTFRHCIFIDCSFERAILNGTRWRSVDFMDCNFMHAEFAFASLRGCMASRCNFSDCDIEYSRGFRFSFCRIENLYSGNVPRDPWSLLMQKYTYTNFILYLAGTLLLLAPHFLFVAATIMLARYQDTILAALRSAGVDSPVLDNAILCGAAACRKTTVSAVALKSFGGGAGRVFTFLVIYNLARFYVTDRILRLKAQYEQSGVTADWRSGNLHYRHSTRFTLTTTGVSKNTKPSTLVGKAWEGVSEFIDTVGEWRVLDIGYRWYYWFHVVTAPLVLLAFIYSGVNLLGLVQSVVYLPSR